MTSTPPSHDSSGGTPGEDWEKHGEASPEARAMTSAQSWFLVRTPNQNGGFAGAPTRAGGVSRKKKAYSPVLSAAVRPFRRCTVKLPDWCLHHGWGGAFAGLGNVSSLPLSRSVLGPSNGRVEAWQGKVVVEHVRWLTSLLSSRSAPPDSDRSARKMPRPNRALQSSCFRHWGCLRVSIATATTNTRFVKCACLA